MANAEQARIAAERLRRGLPGTAPCPECARTVCEPETCPLELLNRLKALVDLLNAERIAIPSRHVDEWRRLSGILKEW